MKNYSVTQLEAEHKASLLRYSELLSECVSARLTGTRDAAEIYELHVKDCLNSVRFLPKEGSVIDVGCGGGLPGVVWAVCRPDLQVCLLDSIGKKCRAVSDIVSALGLKNVEVVHSRSEEFAEKRRESFFMAAARAVARIAVTVEYLSPLVAVGGELLTFKGPKVHEELAEVNGRWGRLGLAEPVLHRCDFQDRVNFFVIWGKKAPCPLEYPRKAGGGKNSSMKGWWL